ncbi:MAG: hypothetical protein AAGB29_13025 [Planctomycetota bacterium]
MTQTATANVSDALVVCGVSFGMSCLAFVLAVAGLIPALGVVAGSLGVADGLVAAGVLALLVASPVAGALLGLTIASRLIAD